MTHPSDRPTLVLAMARSVAKRNINDAHWRRLRDLCNVLLDEPIRDFGNDAARESLARAEILLTGWGCPLVDDVALAAMPNVRAIVHSAGTVKAHLGEPVWQRGIAVTSAAAANAVPVAEYTLAAILLANKRAFQLREQYRTVREGRDWQREAPDIGNYQRVVGLVAASLVGRRVIELLRPFDLSVLVYDPYLTPAEAESLGVTLADLDTLFQRADVVSLHAPLTPQTRGMIGARELALLRQGVTLINTARGALVDHAALESELASGRIHAVIDTTDPEVLPPDSPLYALPNVFLTPHIAGALGNETWRLTDLALDEIERYTKGEPFRFGIRFEDLGRLA